MMGSIGPGLVAAVSNAGGLGILPSWKHDKVTTHRDEIRAVMGLTNRRFGVNLNNQYLQDELLSMAIDEGVSIASFFWGLRADHISRAKGAGMTVLQTIGSAAEAREAIESGADIIVAQGWEAGGHVWSEIATMALVPAVVDAVGPVPVIAAGGIADGRGLAAAMALGAEAGWIGTRFLLAHEALIDDERRGRLIAASEAETLMAKDPNPTWLDSAIRWIDTPLSSGFHQLSGQGVALLKQSQPAAEIVAEIWRDAQATMTALAQRAV